MSRSTAEWIGKTDDTSVPPHVKLRVFRRFNGVCPKCTRKMFPNDWECDHVRALINGGENRERNLWPLCKSPCHSTKTKADVAEKARVYRKAAKYVGINFKKTRPMPGSRASGLKRKMDGTVERRSNYHSFR